MKKHFLIVAMVTMTFALVSCEGTYVVSTRPDHPIYDRPVAPGPDYIWIEGDWIFEGGHYVWHKGYWSRPRGNRHWQEGHWEGKNNGWHWKRGHWK